MPLTNPKKDARLTLRITSETKDALYGHANLQERSVNWLAQRIFDEWLARQKAKTRHRK